MYYQKDVLLTLTIISFEAASPW